MNIRPSGQRHSHDWVYSTPNGLAISHSISIIKGSQCPNSSIFRWSQSRGCIVHQKPQTGKKILGVGLESPSGFAVKVVVNCRRSHFVYLSLFSCHRHKRTASVQRDCQKPSKTKGEECFSLLFSLFRPFLFQA